MKLIPTPPTIGPEDGFTQQNDIFGYKDFGGNLRQVISTSNDPLVILLDGSWRVGKSTFVRQFAGELRKNEVPVIEFDAFANDYHEDAFIALAGDIHDLGKAALGPSGFAKNFLNRAKQVGAAIAPLGARIAIRVATAGMASIDDFESAGEAVKSATKTVGDEISDRLESVISERLQKRKSERATIEGFRKALAELALGMSKQQNNDARNPDQIPPLVIIVDELDRCRPPFTLNLLENIKHLFSVDHVVFLLVTDFKQLQEVVRGSYGAGSNFDARAYLEKFFQIRITLPEPREENRSIRAQYTNYLWRNMELNSGDAKFDELMREGLVMFSQQLDLSLRTIERVVTNFALVYMTTTAKSWRVAPIAYGLCLLRHIAPDTYKKARSGNLTFDEVDGAIGISSLPDEHQKEWHTKWWKFVTSEQLPNEAWVNQMGQSLWNYNLGREHILPYLSGVIDNMKVV